MTRHGKIRHGGAPRADFLNLILAAAGGVFPGPALEALIDRMEAGR